MIRSIHDIMGSINAGDGGVHQLHPTASIITGTPWTSSGATLLSPSRGTKSPWNPGAGMWENM